MATPLTSFDLPNYIGEFLTQGQANENAILKLVGGFNNVLKTVSTDEFAMGVLWTLPDAAAPSITEAASATAPAPFTITLAGESQYTQTFHETIAITDKSLATQGRNSSSYTIPGAGNGILQIDPSTVDGRRMLGLIKIQRDFNYCALNQTGQKATASNVASKMKGLVPSITTSVNTNATDRVVTTTIIEDMQEKLISSGQMALGDVRVLLTTPTLYAKIVTLFASNLPMDRNIVGLGVVKAIETKWGTIIPMFDSVMTAKTAVLVNPAKLGLVANEVPGKGVLYVESLGKVGASEQEQIFAPGLALDFGSEKFHAKADKLLAA